MKIIISSLLVVCILAVGCSHKKASSEMNPEKSVSQDEMTNDTHEAMLVYEGIIPCADCEGIKVTLLLNTQKNRFEERREYLGKEKTEFVAEGNFKTEQGFGNDSDATVFVLNSDKPQAEQSYYLRYSNDVETLNVLTPQKELINSELNYKLKKKII